MRIVKLGLSNIYTLSSTATKRTLLGPDQAGRLAFSTEAIKLAIRQRGTCCCFTMD